MLVQDDIDRVDKSQIHKIYDQWPNLAKQHFERDIQKIDLKDIDHIVFAGMGGSGTIGDIISSVLSKTKLHTTVVKGYLLPKNINENTLIVATSISGNTDETISIAKSSLNSNASFVSFSSGGNLQQFCQKNNLINHTLEIEHSPRASLIGYLFSVLNVLLWVGRCAYLLYILPSYGG